MLSSGFPSIPARRIGAVTVLGYVAIQVFQEFVFSHLPETRSLRDELLQGIIPLNILRSSLMLLSFFGLIYVFVTICAANLRYRFISTLFALICLSIFCTLEICIRSVELFYCQLHLPVLFQQAGDPGEQKRILDIFLSFQNIQFALYFPLMFSQAIGSVILSLTFNRVHSSNHLIMIAFGLNSVRLLGRILGMFLHINWFDSFSGRLYLPFVIAIFGLIFVWLARVPKSGQIKKRQFPA